MNNDNLSSIFDLVVNVIQECRNLDRCNIPISKPTHSLKKKCSTCPPLRGFIDQWIDIASAIRTANEIGAQEELRCIVNR